MIYLDTSAFLKTVLDEPESSELQAYLNRFPSTALVSSKLLAVEARRGVLRTLPSRMPRLEHVLPAVRFVSITDPVIELAGRLPDPMLRGLDAIHLATALLVREDIDVLVSYDDRLLGAATAHGLKTATPA